MKASYPAHDLRTGRAQLGAALAIAAAVLLVLGTSVFRGVPAFQQDWLWPFTRPNAVAFFLDAGNVWHDGGLGFASVAPNATVAAQLLLVPAIAFGPIAGLNFDLCLLVLAGVFGMIAYLRASGFPWHSALLGAVIYALAPLFYNKLQAGHYFFLVSVASLPLALFFLAKARTGRALDRVRSALIAGVFLALGAGQFQFAAIASIVAAVDVCFARSRSAILASVIAVGTMVALHASDYIVMLSPESIAAALPQATPGAWLVAQSQPLGQALTGIAYIGHYAEHGLAVPMTLAVALAITLISSALLLCVRARRDARVKTVVFGLVLVIIGGVLVAGTYTPAGSLMQALLATNVRFSVFRELYDFELIVVLGMAIVFGAASSLQTRLRIPLVVAGLALCAIYAGIYLKRPPSLTIPTIGRASDASLAESGHPGRVMFLPGAPSLSLRGWSASGVDSFSQPLPDGAAPLTYPFVDAKYAYLFSSLANINSLASRIGVREIIPRANVVSNYPEFLDPHSREVALQLGSRNLKRPSTQYFSAASSLRSVELSSRVEGGIPLWPVVANLDPAAHLVSEPFADFNVVPQRTVGVDPLHDWVESLRWLPALPALSCFPSGSLFHITSLGLLRGNESSCSWTIARSGNLACYELSVPGLKATGGCVAASVWRSSQAALRRHIAGVASGKEKLVFLRESYDPRWRLDCGGVAVHGDSVLVDAYAMGWFIGASKCASPVASFQFDRWYWPLVLITWIAISLLILQLSLRKRTLDSQ